MIRKLWQDGLVQAFLWLGTRIYRVVLAKPVNDEVVAVHFAASERDLNNSMRDYVEELDRPK